ncbi:MAG: hypothetical protein RJB66_2296 [Pseudomonadota bacterium]|jgi:hypothetical protein
MIKIYMGTLSLAIVYLIYGFMVSTYAVDRGHSAIHHSHPYPFFDYRGVTNVSTNRSLGSGSDREVIEEAKQAELDYLFITDYNVIDGHQESEGYHGDLLVLRGKKFSYLDSRLLYYRSDAFPEAASLGEIQVHLTDLLSQPLESRGDSQLVLAHPYLKGYGWSGEWPIGLDGLEVINFKRVQQQHFLTSQLSSFWSLLIYPFNPQLAFIRLFAEPNEEIQLWSSLNRTRVVTGHLGLEATAKAIPITGSVIKFPNYETLFRLGSEHVLLRSELTGNVTSDKIKILKALRKGEFYFSLDVLGNPKGFNVVIQDDDQLYLMGSTVRLKNKMKFHIEVPPVTSPAEIIVYRDGEIVQTLPGRDVDISLEQTGSYRFVVRLKVELPIPEKTHWIPWIYTNHFLVQ